MNKNHISRLKRALSSRKKIIITASMLLLAGSGLIVGIVNAVSNGQSFTISYSANDSVISCNASNMPTSSNTTLSAEADATVAVSSTVPTCSGYMFAGWVIATDDITVFNDSYFRMPSKNVTITATWEKATITKSMKGTEYKMTLSTIDNMQQMTHEICEASSTGETNTLIDTRENGINSYIVSKADDGNCWMLQNLRLGSSVATDGSITVDKVNNTTGKTDGTFSLSGKVASGGKFSYSSNNGFNYTNDSPQFACNDDYGCYYNWAAATAGTGLSSTSSGDASASICPAGWVLPSRANNVSLASAYGNTAANLLVPSDIRSTDTLNSGGAIPGLTLGGYYYTSGRDSAGSRGYYWSRTAYSGQYAYLMRLYSSSVYASVSGNKYVGFSVRCMSL